MKKLFFVLILFCYSNVYSQLNQCFIENKGQWDDEVLFLARINGMYAWITKDGISYDFYKFNDQSKYQEYIHPMLKQEEFYRNNPYDYSEKIPYTKNDDFNIEGHIVKLSFVGANKHNKIQKSAKLETYYNYYLGNDTKHWVSRVPLYQEILMEDVYNGIDFRYYFDDGYLRYDLNIGPNADIKKIKMKYTGQDSILINKLNELVIKTSIGDVIHKGLVAFQLDEKKSGKSQSVNEVNCEYIINSDNTVGFEVKDYDKKSQLIIDPFIFSSVFGAGDILDEHPYLAIDSSKNVYTVGFTFWAGMPTTPGAYRRSGYGPSGQKNGDIIVTKLSPNGTKLLYMTYIGGTYPDLARGIVVDKEGNAIIIGESLSQNYPTTAGVVRKHIENSRSDIVISKFNPDGTDLIFSTYFGGDYTDQWANLAIDDDANLYVTGLTFSRVFPITENALFSERTSFSYCDMFFSVLNSDATKVIYSTFINGSHIDWASDITLDKNKNVYLTGWTYSDDFLVTNDAFDKTKGFVPNDSADAFIMIFAKDNYDLKYSTYIGGNQSDRASCIAIDKQDNICLAGFTLAEDFPITHDAYDNSYAGAYDSFFCKFSPDGKNLLYSTFFGGSENDWIQDIAIDNKNNVYLIGAKQELELMVDTDTTKNARDFKTMVSRISSDNQKVDYYRLIGDTILSSNFGNSIVVDELEDIYIAGTEYWGFPTTKGAFNHDSIRPPLNNGGQSNESSGGYIFVCKLNFKCDDMAFNYPNFSNYTNFIFNGSAKQNNNKLMLTESKPWQSGSVWYREKVHIESGFVTEFSFSFKNGIDQYGKEKYKGADGIAFVIQNESPEALGLYGEWIGFGGIKNSFAIEFDTYRNIFFESDVQNIDDPSESHVAIFSNGQEPNLSKHDSKACLATYDDCIDIVPDGTRYYVRIQYLQLFKTLQIYLDTNPKFTNPKTKSMTLIGYDISDFVNFDEGGKAWVGFTSGTGIAYEEHFIDSWEFCPFVYYGNIATKTEENVITNNEWIIYPNPADDYIMINNSALKNELLNIDIFDIFGNNVHTQSTIDASGFVRIETNSLSTGKYFVRIVQGEQVSTTVFTIIR